MSVAPDDTLELSARRDAPAPKIQPTWEDLHVEKLITGFTKAASTLLREDKRIDRAPSFGATLGFSVEGPSVYGCNALPQDSNLDVVLMARNGRAWGDEIEHDQVVQAALSSRISGFWLTPFGTGIRLEDRVRSVLAHCHLLGSTTLCVKPLMLPSRFDVKPASLEKSWPGPESQLQVYAVPVKTMRFEF